MRVLIINDYFPPSSSVGAQRVTSWVQHWSAAEVPVHLVSTQPQLSFAPQFNPQYTYLHSMAGEAEASTGSPPVHRSSWLNKIHRFLKAHVFCNLLEPRLLKLPRLKRLALDVVAAHDITHIVSSSPSFVSHLVARSLKKRNSRLTWVADYRDLWSGNPIFPGARAFARLESALERRVLASADAVTTINSVLAGHLEKLSSKPVHIVTNGIDLTDLKRRKRPAVADITDEARQPFRIVYTGAVLHGLYDADPLIRAVANMVEQYGLKEGDLSVDFYGQQDGLNKKLIGDLKVQQFFNCFGSVSRSESLDIQASSDALLFLGAQPNGGAGIDGVVSGKVFEYLTAGAPVLAVGVRPGMIVYQLLLESGVALAISSDPVEIGNSILDAMRSRQGGMRIRVSCNSEVIERYRRDVLAGQMLQIVKNA